MSLRGDVHNLFSDCNLSLTCFACQLKRVKRAANSINYIFNHLICKIKILHFISINFCTNASNVITVLTGVYVLCNNVINVPFAASCNVCNYS